MKKTYDDLKNATTPKIIKQMVELAEGFRLLDDYTLFAFEVFDCKISGIHESLCLFPLLLHRAVEGWNKQQKLHREIVIYKNKACEEDYKLETHNGYEDYYKYTYVNNYFKNYQPCHHVVS